MDSILNPDTCREEMIRIVENLFRTMLAREVETAAKTVVFDDDGITATVSFMGSWTGALSLQCSTRQAKRFAELIMGNGSGNLDEEYRDVMAELTNIIAGNLKAVLPYGAQSSPPSVSTGSELSSGHAKAPVLAETAFELDDSVFLLVLANRHQEPSERRTA
jgi:CheY-specific phosphatase CheX